MGGRLPFVCVRGSLWGVCMVVDPLVWHGVGGGKGDGGVVGLVAVKLRFVKFPL